MEIPDKMKHEAPKPLAKQQYTPPAPQNQVYSRSRQALSNPMYAQQSGAGQVGIGPDSPLGNRLGWYAELVRQRIAQNWLTNGLDARTQSQPAIVSFYIMRDGTIRNPQIVGIERQSPGRQYGSAGRVRSESAAAASTADYRELYLGSVYFQFTLMRILVTFLLLPPPFRGSRPVRF